MVSFQEPKEVKMSTKKIKKLIIHCSDSIHGDVEEIRRWHVNGNGWRDIGYHAVILNGCRRKNKFIELDDGLLEMGREINLDDVITPSEMGAHVRGNNSDSIGICLVGRCKFTKAQFESLFYFCKMWLSMIPDLEIIGHSELDKRKTCPNIDMDTLRSALKSNKILVSA